MAVQEEVKEGVVVEEEGLEEEGDEDKADDVAAVRGGKGKNSVHHKHESVASIVKNINSKYEKTDTGVFMRLIAEAYHNPWNCCMTHEQPGCKKREQLGSFSFGMVNQLAWMPRKGRLNTYGEADDFWGYIGTDASYKSAVHCVYPGDGGTMGRAHLGCGCRHECQQNPKISGCTGGCTKDGWDWCDAHDPPIFATGHFGCVLRPSQVSEMYAQFHYYQSSAAKKIDKEYDIEHFVEVVVSGKEWNSGVCEHIRSFVVLPACAENAHPCFKAFEKYYKEFNKVCKFTDSMVPIVLLNTSKKSNPFQPFHGTVK